MNRRCTVAALLATLVLPLSACISMPESGPVVETRSEGNPEDQAGTFIDAKPPQQGDSATDIVTGFLEAMTATPIDLNVAREFLTRDAEAAWKPDTRTITYAEVIGPLGSSTVTVELAGAEHLDHRGAFLGSLPKEDRALRFPMRREDGQWRIAAAPDALIVPESWFEQVFSHVSLYFFDPSAQILVPEPVFVPFGEEQLPTELTRALLRGPSQRLDDVSRSFIPPGLDVFGSVPVSDEGVADLTLRGYTGELTPQASQLMLAQLAWTLRQDPGVAAFRVSIGGQQVTLPGGESEFSVDQGLAYDPTGLQASSLLFGLSGGRLVSGPPGGLTEVSGPMGSSVQGVRSMAVNLNATSVAGVTGSGERVLLTTVRGTEETVEEEVSGAENLLRPAWDFTDRLWLVDNRETGAEVSYLGSQGPVSVKVRGISGRNVSRFLVSRDGSRLVAVLPRPQGDRLLVSRILHGADGKVIGATRAQEIAWEGESGLRIRDIGWSSPGSIAVLHRVAKELFELRTIAVDGAPSGVDDLLTTLPGRVLGLASSPVAEETLYAVTNSSLLDPRGETPQAGLDAETTLVGYVG